MHTVHPGTRLPLPLLDDSREMLKHAGSDRISLSLALKDGTSS